MAVMTRRGSHLGRPIEIQGVLFYTFYNGHLRGIIWTVHRDRTATNFFETVHDGPFHRNRRSFRSDSYAQMYYKTKCSSDVLSIRVEI